MSGQEPVPGAGSTYRLRLPRSAADVEAETRRREDEAHRAAREAELAAARESGRREGLELGRADVGALIDRAGQILAAIDAARRQLLADERAELIGTVLACARDIAGDAVVRDPKVIEALVDRVLAGVERERALVIELAPAQAALLRELWATRPPVQYAESRWKIAAAEELGPADCRLRFDNGYLDGRLEVRLSELRATLLERALVAESDDAGA